MQAWSLSVSGRRPSSWRVARSIRPKARAMRAICTAFASAGPCPSGAAARRLRGAAQPVPPRLVGRPARFAPVVRGRAGRRRARRAPRVRAALPVDGAVRVARAPRAGVALERSTAFGAGPLSVAALVYPHGSALPWLAVPPGAHEANPMMRSGL